MAQVVFVRDHLADIESDMSAIHRVDDIWQMESPRFFQLAWRLPAYQGVMMTRARMLAQAQGDGRVPRRPVATASSRPQSPGYREVPATRAALSIDPATRGIFSFATATES